MFRLGDLSVITLLPPFLVKTDFLYTGLGLPAVMVARSQSMPPSNQVKVKQEFLNPPRKVEECFRQPPERKSSVKKKSSARKCNQKLLSPSVEDDIGSKDVKSSRKIKLLRSLKSFRIGMKYRIQK